MADDEAQWAAAQAEDEARRQDELAQYAAEKAAEAVEPPPGPPLYPQGAHAFKMPRGEVGKMYARLETDSADGYERKMQCSVETFITLFTNPKTRPFPIPVEPYLANKETLASGKRKFDMEKLTWLERHHLIEGRNPNYMYPIPVCICVGRQLNGDFIFVACGIESRGTVRF